MISSSHKLSRPRPTRKIIKSTSNSSSTASSSNNSSDNEMDFYNGSESAYNQQSFEDTESMMAGKIGTNTNTKQNNSGRKSFRPTSKARQTAPAQMQAMSRNSSNPFLASSLRNDKYNTLSNNNNNNGDGFYEYDPDEFADELPLMQELGINLSHIWIKTLYVLIPRKKLDCDILKDGDLAGPLIFGLFFGFCLLFAGKLHFGYIYGFSMIGCFGLYIVFNLMSIDVDINLLHTVSIIGYCVLPITLLACVNIVIDLRGKIGFGLAIFVVLWSSMIATRFIENLANMRHQRYLIAYPLALFYSCFALITVF